jgi:LysR family glycine cleavage system transcriptional activator
MDLARIQCIWPYLPAFVAVAEAQHLRGAARELRVSPSALSRSIGILEHRIGQPLFERRGGRMHLNAFGVRLNGTVREIIQMVDGAVDGDQRASADVLRMLPC